VPNVITAKTANPHDSRLHKKGLVISKVYIWRGALSASGFQGHPQSALSVPSFVTFPFVIAVLVAWHRRKSNKNTSSAGANKKTAVLPRFTAVFCKNF